MENNTQTYNQKAIDIGNQVINEMLQSLDVYMRECSENIMIPENTSLSEIMILINDAEKYVTERITAAMLPSSLLSQLTPPPRTEEQEFLNPPTTRSPEEILHDQIHSRYAYGDNPNKIAEDLSIELNQVAETLGLSSNQEPETPEEIIEETEGETNE